jgi:hypothetical protein
VHIIIYSEESFRGRILFRIEIPHRIDFRVGIGAILSPVESRRKMEAKIKVALS